MRGISQAEPGTEQNFHPIRRDRHKRDVSTWQAQHRHQQILFPYRHTRTDAEVRPYAEIQFRNHDSLRSHARAPVFQLQVDAGAAAEDIQGWAVGDINQAARADLVVPLFRAEAQRLEGLARARQLDC